MASSNLVVEPERREQLDDSAIVQPLLWAGSGLGRPYWMGAIALIGGLSLASFVAFRSPVSADHRLVLAAMAATAAATLTIPTGVLLASHGRFGARRADVDAGLVVMLLGVGWLLPARLGPMLNPAAAEVGLAFGFGVSLAVLVLARSSGGAHMAATIDVAERVRRIVMLALGASAAALVAEMVAPISLQGFFSPLVSTFFAISGVLLLVRGYRADQWSLTVIGMQLVAVQFGDVLLAVDDDVSSGAWLGACLMALVGALIGTAGALAIARRASQEAQQSILDGALNELVMKAEREQAEEVMHDLRSGLLSVEAFAGSMGGALQSASAVELLVGEIARLRARADKQPTVEVVDLSSGIHQLVATWSALGMAASVEVEPSIGIEAKGADVLDVVQNLIENAFRHGGGVVRVTASLDKSTAQISIADQGPGFDEDSIACVFDRGFTTSPQGSGLGLHIVRQRVTALGGTVAAKNQPGGGARVDVWLPARRLRAG